MSIQVVAERQNLLSMSLHQHEGEWLRAELKRRKINQEEFADQLAISRNTLNNLLNRVQLSPVYRDKIFSLLGITRLSNQQIVDGSVSMNDESVHASGNAMAAGHGAATAGSSGGAENEKIRLEIENQELRKQVDFLRELLREVMTK